MADKKYLDYDGLLYFFTGLKSKFVSSIAYDTTNHQLTQTKNGTSSVVITTANLKSELGIDNVGNYKAVSTVANQGLTEQEKANARANIGAGDSAFSGDFSDLSNIPTTIAGYGITDAKIESGTITLGSNTITPLTQHQDISGKADKATTIAGYGITDAKIANGTITLGSNTIKPLTQHQDISGKADKATTLAGYGITDAKIANGVITLGSNTITPLTQHQDISGKADKATTLAGYGITDAKIENGVITLGSATYNLAGLYKYKGSVATKAALPTHASTPAPVAGDVYNVESDGKNYAYVKYNTTTGEDEWDDLGGTFTITSISNSEIDTILAS